nr:WD40 repeat-containing protein [Oceanusvirus sp.]
MVDPLSLTLTVIACLRGINEDHRSMRSSLRTATRRMEHLQRVLQIPNLELLVSSDTMQMVRSVLSEIHEATTELQSSLAYRFLGIPVGAASVYLGGCLIGTRMWATRIDSLSRDLEDSMRFVDQHVAVSDAMMTMGSSSVFATRPQISFWRNFFGDMYETDHRQLARAFRNLSLMPERLCLHVASGIAPGRGYASVSALAAEFGTDDPLDWLLKRSMDVSKTTGFAGHSRRVTHVEQNGQWCVTCSVDRTAKLFRGDVLVGQMIGHERRVVMSCMSGADHEDLRVFTISDDHTLRAWDSTGGCTFVHHTGDSVPVFVACYGLQVVYFCKDHLSAKLVSGADGSAIRVVSPYSGVLSAVHCRGNAMWCVSVNGALSEMSMPDGVNAAYRRETVHLTHASILSSAIDAGIICVGGGMATFCPINGGERRTVDAYDPSCMTPLAVWMTRAEGDLLVATRTFHNDDVVVTCISMELEFPSRAPEVFDQLCVKNATCARFTSRRDLVCGTRDGSTVVLDNRWRYRKARTVIVGCMNNSTYLHDIASDALGVHVSLAKRSVLIGPRKVKENDYAHGVVSARDRAAYVWDVHTGAVRDATSDTWGVKVHTPTPTREGWLVGVELQGKAVKIEPFTKNVPSSLTYPDVRLGSSETVQCMLGVGDAHVVLEIDDVPRMRHRVVMVRAGEGAEDKVGGGDEGEVTNIPSARILCSSEKEVVVFRCEERTLALLSLDGTVTDMPYKPYNFTSASATWTRDGTAVVLCNGTLHRAKTMLDEPNLRRIDLPPDITGLAAITSDTIVGFGNLGRFFSIDLSGLEVTTTFVTHPSRATVVQTAVDDEITRIVAYDHQGALLHADSRSVTDYRRRRSFTGSETAPSASNELAVRVRGLRLRRAKRLSTERERSPPHKQSSFNWSSICEP